MTLPYVRNARGQLVMPSPALNSGLADILASGAIERERFLTNHRHLMVPILFHPQARQRLDSLLLKAQWDWTTRKLEVSP